MLNKKNAKIALFYLFLQGLIWVKSAAFFSLYGHGKALEFAQGNFPPEALVFDFLFHEGMHVAIGILALSFGKNIEKLEWAKLAALIAIAVFAHNVGYWLTASHPEIVYSMVDFVRDSIILMAFVVAGYYLKKPFNKVEKFLRNSLQRRA